MYSGPRFLPPHNPHRRPEWAQQPQLWSRCCLAPPEALPPLLPHQLHGCGPCLSNAGYHLRGALQRPTLLCQVLRAMATTNPSTGVSVPYRGFHHGPLPIICRSPQWCAQTQRYIVNRINYLFPMRHNSVETSEDSSKYRLEV